MGASVPAWGGGAGRGAMAKDSVAENDQNVANDVALQLTYDHHREVRERRGGLGGRGEIRGWGG